MRFVAHVEVSLKPGLLDPQGKAIEGSLPALGWSNVTDVRVGKYIRLELEAKDHEAAVAQVREMSERLLSNPVIESFAIRDVSEHASLQLEDRPA
jgi:phosphoribosylformylglycinamidine synthase PurS subunit